MLIYRVLERREKRRRIRLMRWSEATLKALADPAAVTSPGGKLGLGQVECAGAMGAQRMRVLRRRAGGENATGKEREMGAW